MIDEILQLTEEKMQQSVESVRRNFASLRTGQASTAILEGVMVDYYGTPTPLAQTSKLAIPDPSLIVAQPFDPTMLLEIEKSIRNADLGLNPSNDGKVIRIPIPPLTEERRIELTKVAGKYAEEARVAVRNVRRHAMDELKKAEKDGDISQDEHHDFGRQIQELTDENIKKIDAALEAKESEIMQV